MDASEAVDPSFLSHHHGKEADGFRLESNEDMLDEREDIAESAVTARTLAASHSSHHQSLHHQSMEQGFHRHNYSVQQGISNVLSNAGQSNAGQSHTYSSDFRVYTHANEISASTQFTNSLATNSLATNTTNSLGELLPVIERVPSHTVGSLARHPGVGPGGVFSPGVSPQQSPLHYVTDSGSQSRLPRMDPTSQATSFSTQNRSTQPPLRHSAQTNSENRSEARSGPPPRLGNPTSSNLSSISAALLNPHALQCGDVGNGGENNTNPNSENGNEFLPPRRGYRKH